MLTDSNWFTIYHPLYTALDYLRERIPAGHRLTVDLGYAYCVFHELPED